MAGKKVELWDLKWVYPKAVQWVPRMVEHLAQYLAESMAAYLAVKTVHSWVDLKAFHLVQMRVDSSAVH